MYIAKSTNSTKLSIEEQEKVNRVIQKLQAENGKEINSFRDVVNVFAETIENTSENQTKTPENVIRLHSDLYEKCKEHILKNGGTFDENGLMNSSFTEEKLMSFLLETFPHLEKVETVEKEKELEENQFIISLSQDQKDIIDEVIKNRSERYEDLDKEPETINQVLLKSFFNKARLGNWDEEFYTGL